MSFLKKSFRYVTDSTLRTFVGIVVLSLIITGIAHFVRNVNAAPITNWQTMNNPSFRLEGNITPSQTTGIKIATPEKNGDDYTFPTTTGGILRIRRGAFFEDIYYSTGS